MTLIIIVNIKKRSAKAERYLNCINAALASQRGVEPPAYCLGGSRSILLSYWDTFYLIFYHIFLLIASTAA